jgi:CRISPR/Cas system CSM-associated protein Csm4 (group 5 of RAMP superfamily)
MFKFNKDNIVYWARQYEDHYDPEDKSNEERLKNLLKRQRYLTQKNLLDIMDWKAARIKNYAKENAPSMIVRITRNSFETKDEQGRIESLLGQKGGLRGVGYPVASTILHFAFPDRYPIMDFRVIRSLGMKQPSSYKFDFWENYCKRIKHLSKKYGLTIRVVEKALWKFDKEQYSRFNKCD